MAGTTRKQQKLQTKLALLETAYKVFSDKGILNARMADIAKAAGVSHGTVFLHFSTQESLVTEVVDLYCGKIAARTHDLAGSGGSLRDILTAHLDGIQEFEPFYTRLVIENRLLPRAARDAWITVQSAVSFHFSQSVANEVHLEISHDVLFSMWIGLVHHYLSNGDLFAPDGNVIQHRGKELIDNYLKLLIGKEVPK